MLYRINCEDRNDYTPSPPLVRRIGQRMSKPSDITTFLAGFGRSTRPAPKLANTSDSLLIALSSLLSCGWNPQSLIGNPRAKTCKPPQLRVPPAPQRAQTSNGEAEYKHPCEPPGRLI